MHTDFAETQKKIISIMQPLIKHMEIAYIGISSIEISFNVQVSDFTNAFDIYERAKFRYLLEVKKERRRKRYYRMMERMRKK